MKAHQTCPRDIQAWCYSLWSLRSFLGSWTKQQIRYLKQVNKVADASINISKALDHSPPRLVLAWNRCHYWGNGAWFLQNSWKSQFGTSLGHLRGATTCVHHFPCQSIGKAYLPTEMLIHKLRGIHEIKWLRVCCAWGAARHQKAQPFGLGRRGGLKR